MRAKVGLCPAPSPAALRFLRQQAEGTKFFTARLPFSVGQCTYHHGTSAHGKVEKLGQRRHLTASATRHAKLVSDFLTPDPSIGSVVPICQSNLLGGFALSKTLQRHRDCSDDHRWSDRRSGAASHSWFRRLINRNGGEGREAQMNGAETPRLPSFLDGSSGSAIGRNKAGKPGSEVKLRCTEIDDNGNVITVDREFKKSELIAKYGLLPRDLRKIDSSLLPHILVRPSAILINLLHLRVLIKHNCVLVLDAYGSTDSFAQSQFMYDLTGKLSQKDTRQTGGLPYEFRALEAVLISVTSGLEAEFEGVSEPVVRVLRELEEDIDRDKLRHLLVYSKKLGTFEQKARLVREAIDDLLEADDDLVTMYLSERAQGKVREEQDHTEVEMLLESYHKVCDEIVQISGNLVNNIRNTEEIVKAILDANRNSLMLLDLKFSIGTLGIGSGAFVASLYGMNLKNFLEESDIGFFGVSGWSFVFAAAVCMIGLKKLRKVQRVSMWGEPSRGAERVARREVGGPPLPKLDAQARRERLEKMRKGAATLEEKGGEVLPPPPQMQLERT